jgi:hypothetical protein
MNGENLKRQWMRSRRCENIERLFIIRKFGCQKLMCCVLFCVLSVFLFVCIFMVFDFCSSIELRDVGVGDGVGF